MSEKQKPWTKPAPEIEKRWKLAFPKKRKKNANHRRRS